MFGFGKKEMGIVGAAALAACSPEAEQAPAESAPTEEVTPLSDESTVEYYKSLNAAQAAVVEGERISEEFDQALAEKYNILPAQYTPEQEAEILSGTTGEPDTMTREQLEELGRVAEESQNP